MIPYVLRFAGLLALALAAACAGGGGDGDAGPDTGSPCSTDADCKDGWSCESGTCTAPASLRISTTRLPPALAGSGYTAQLEATGAEGRVAWSMIAPSWLSIDAATGRISGRPTEPDAVGSLLQVHAKDEAGHEADAQLRLPVRECTPGAEIACQQAEGATCSTGLRTCGEDGFYGACGQLAPSNDAERCGAACDACPAGSACVAGACTCGSDEGCGAGQKCCGGACTPVLDDVANCGQCGNVCPDPGLGGTTVACEDGSCVQSCEAGFADCDQDESTGCEERLDQDDNCGGCFVDCTSMQTPHAGTAVCDTTGTPACSPVCDEPRWDDCDGDLVTGCERPMTAASDCGACDRACPPVRNATPFCQYEERCLGPTRDPACDGETPLCGFTCLEGFADCNGRPDDGCETDLRNDEGSCGQCGRSCTGTCSNGDCHVTCSYPWGDCDGDGFNGCETNLDTSVNNCGSCGSSCDFGLSCEDGGCCNDGFGEGCLPGCCSGLSCTRDPDSGDRTCL